MGFTLLDDGTLDTVIVCDDCGEAFSGTFGGEHSSDCTGDDCLCYEDFAEWLLEQVADDHDCREEGRG